MKMGPKITLQCDNYKQWQYFRNRTRFTFSPTFIMAEWVFRFS